MRKLLLILYFCLSGCFWVVDDNPRDDSYHDQSVAMWFSDAWAACYYDNYSGYSDWYFYAIVDSSEGYDEIYGVEVIIKDVSYIEPDYALWLYWGENGTWDASFSSWYYDCNYAYDLRFIAYDYTGNSMDTWVIW
jgi:hypothetical protein